MRRIATYWLNNWDYWLIVFIVVVLIALPIGATIGAIGDTVDQIRAGY